MGRSSGAPRVRRVWMCTLVAVTGGALLFGAGAAGAQEGGDEIDIVATPAPGDGPCRSADAALRHQVLHDDATYTLRIDVTAPLCEPVDAVAAIYAMPGNGAAWPQRLLQTEGFTLGEPGVVDVVFSKTCRPVQFDVVTGATPAIISPLGEHHGPLLFPIDVNTSYQHFGGDCPPATPPAPPTPPAPAPTSTAPADTTPVEVAAVTTSAVPGVDSPVPTDEPLVLAAAQEPDGPSELARAGANVWSVVFAGLALASAGASALSLRRARRPA